MGPIKPSSPPGSQKISPGPFAYLLAKDLVLRDPFSRDGPIWTHAFPQGPRRKLGHLLGQSRFLPGETPCTAVFLPL
jgi:hypothetical protein